MNISCDVIRDLLPLYAEDMVSRDSARLVEEHLKSCPSCAKELEALRQQAIPIPRETGQDLKHFRNRLLWIICGIGAALILPLMLLLYIVGVIMQIFV